MKQLILTAIKFIILVYLLLNSCQENTYNLIKKKSFAHIKHYNYLPETGQVLDFKHEIKINPANKASSMGLPLPDDIIPLVHPTLLMSILSRLLSAFFPTAI